MFICHECAKENYVIDEFWLLFGPQSRGPCEDCGKIAVCVDMPSSSWKPKPKHPTEKPPPANALTAAHHLQEEVLELIENLPIGHEPTAKAEYADCFLLLFGSACLYGLTYEDICQAINDKMEINKQRQWGKPNDKGYVKHVDS